MSYLLPNFVKKILQIFTQANFQIYIVGGAVRDLSMKRPVNDWDFTTNALPEQIVKLFPKNSFYDNQFGTVGVVNPKEKQTNYYGKTPVYEITTFRKEIGYKDRRHPDQILWGKTLKEDLVRRDFTINAMALDPKLKLIDPHGGQIDIQKKLIRAVGEPQKRFQEDALRMLRAMRIATQLEFKIEDKTLAAIRKNINLIDCVSGERIRDELFKMLSYPKAADGYLLLHHSGLAQKIIPEIEKGFGVEQKSPSRHHVYDVGTHSVESLRASRSLNPLINLAILTHDVGKPLVMKKQENGVITFFNHEIIGASLAHRIGRRLKLSRKDLQKLVILVRWHQFTVEEKQQDKAVRRFIKNVGKENLADILEVRRADRLGGGARETSWRLERFKKKLIEVQKQPFTTTDLKIDGHDVMEICKLSPGPKVGQILEGIFTEVINKKIKNNRKDLLLRLKKTAAETQTESKPLKAVRR